jgi:hypothetical protein
MFAGVSTARFWTDNLPKESLAILYAIVSKDGEVILFLEPISISHGTGVILSLKEVESNINTTLSMLKHPSPEMI